MIQSILPTNRPLAELLLRTHKNVFSSKIGENTTNIKGSGYDFVHLKEYENGGDVKHIDWLVSAKFNKHYVKVFQEQRELHLVIVPLLSASVRFGVKVLKQDIIAEICALLSFSAVKQNNTFSSYISQEKTTLCTPRSKSLFNVRSLVEKTFESDTLGKAINYQELSKVLYMHEREKSLLFLVGDFFQTDSFDFHALCTKHELTCIVVRDKFEEEPESLGRIHLRDPHSGEAAFVELNAKASAKIKQKVLQADSIFFDKLSRAGVRFIKVYTNEDPAKKIMGIMSRLS